MASPLPKIPPVSNHGNLPWLDDWYRLQRWVVSQIIQIAGGGGGGGACVPTSSWADHVEAVVAALPELAPTAVLSDASPGALQAAINALAPGGVLHVATDATYAPVQLPGSKAMTIMAAPGRSPKISGANAITIMDGVVDVTVAGFELPSCSTGAPNELGACIALDHQARFERVIFSSCNLRDVTSGSGVMLSYHQTLGGDNYAVAPVYPGEFSFRLAFVGCTFVHAGVEGIEGANLAIRGVEYAYVRGCTVDGDNQDSRGIQFQDCISFLCEECVAGSFTGNGCEAFKADYLGAGGPPVSYRTSGVFRSCMAHDAYQGFDSDDQTACYAVNCVAVNCSIDGFHVKGSAGNPTPGWAAFECCTAHGCGHGFYVRSGSSAWLRNNNAFNNTTDYLLEAPGYGLPVAGSLDPSNVVSP